MSSHFCWSCGRTFAQSDGGEDIAVEVALRLYGTVLMHKACAKAHDKHVEPTALARRDPPGGHGYNPDDL